MTELTSYEICNRLEKAGRTLILGHVNPDADCLGSAFALSEILRSLGKEADVACDGKVPDRLAFLCDQVFSPDEVSAEKYGTILSVDVASPSQLGAFADLIPKIDMMIDHHGTGETFADHCVVPTASAAGEIIYLLYRELVFRRSIPKNNRVLRFLYAAIASDTGSFKFSNTTPHTLQIASEISAEINYANDGGLDTSDICRLLFGRFTEREMQAKMLTIQNMKLTEGGRLGSVFFSRELLEENGLNESDIGNAVDTPRCIDGVLVALSIRQVGDTTYKISSRANVDIDCAAVCAKYGGGGHLRAAGCTVEAASADEIYSTVVESFAEAVRSYLASAPIEKTHI